MVILALLLLALGRGLSAQAVVTLRPGLAITRSVRVAPDVYHLAAPASLDSPLVVVRGDDVTVDLRGSTLLGSSDNAPPDEARGVAILVDGGRNVTIRGGRIHGYRVAILARGTRNLVLADNDLSRSWKPRLYSLIEHESLVDWLSFHHNEHNEWLRFGAGIYLENIHGGEIRGNVAEQGMNALLMTRSESLLVWNNNFSFNSGLGIGLYRSSDNRVMHNQVDYNVRGYSEGFYHRGQDSAGILLYEQSCRNLIAYNSATHSGDGFFLWAGQSTMDTGAGGANDNVVYSNDFGYAPANGIEATFSRNAFLLNTVVGSDYGVWGGYSFDSWIGGNDLLNNRIGVAIEHGQSNRIVGNRLASDSTAIQLWADSIQPSDWGYPKHRDTRSRDNVIADNLFLRNRVGVRVSNSGLLTMHGNQFDAVDSAIVATNTRVERRDSTSGENGLRAKWAPPESLRVRLPQPLPNAQQTTRPVAKLPRSAIIVDEWGPYDWRAPKLWPLDSTRAVPLRLAVLGPTGSWSVARAQNVTLSKRAGRIDKLGAPDTVAVTPRPDSLGNWMIELSWTRDPGARPVRFRYARFEPPITWTQRVFVWSDSSDPRTKPDAFNALLRGAPLLERQVPRLDLMWYRPTIAGIPAQQWALEATGTVQLPPGRYTLQTISDDAVRVWIDDTLAIDDWIPHESRVDVAPLGEGKHIVRVQYVQVDGWAELRLDVLRGRPTASRGSPGPH